MESRIQFSMALAFAFSLMPLAAAGECVVGPTAVPKAVVVDVSQAGLKSIGQMAATRIPRHLEIKDKSIDLVVGDVTIGKLAIELTPEPFQVEANQGQLGISGAIGVHVYTNTLSILGDDNCEFTASLPRVTVNMNVDLSRSGQCELGVAVTDVTIDLGGSNSGFELDSCGIFSGVFDAVDFLAHNLVLSLVESRIESVVEDFSSSSLPTLMSGLLPYAGETMGMAFGVGVSQVLVDSEGLRLVADVNVAAQAENACLPAQIVDSYAAPELSGVNPERINGEHPVTVSINRDLLKGVSFQAWRAGLFCIEAGAERLDLAPLKPYLKPGTDPSLYLRVEAPPALEIAASASNLLSIQLGLPRVVAGLSLESPAATSAVEAGFDLGLQVELRNDVMERNLYMGLQEMNLTSVSLRTLSGKMLAAPDDRTMANVIAKVARPALAEKIEGLPLFANLFNVSGLAVLVQDVIQADNALQIGADFFVPGNQDQGAPTTQVADYSRGPIRAADFYITVKSTDAETPQTLIAHTVTPGFEGNGLKLQYGSRLRAPNLATGEHRLMVAAVDLSGNVGKAFPLVNVIIDNDKPTLRWGRRDTGVLSRSWAQYSVIAKDNITENAGEFHYRWLLTNADTKEIVQEVGNGMATMRFVDLSEDTVYKVTALVSDQAGNTEKLEWNFSVNEDKTGACQMSAGRSVPAWWALLLLGQCVPWPRRRR